MADSWVRWYGDRVISEAEAAVERGLSKLAQQIRQEAQASMNLPKTGKKYKRLRTRSSAPYEAPAAQTGGGLQSHIAIEQRGPMMRLIGVERGDEEDGEGPGEGVAGEDAGGAWRRYDRRLWPIPRGRHLADD